MRSAVAPAATAQSLAGRSDIVRIGRRVERPVGVMGWLLGFVIMLLGWQIALFLALVGGGIQFGVYAGTHILGCFVLAAYLVCRLNGAVVNERYSAALQMVAWSALAGPFGSSLATYMSPPPALASGPPPKSIEPKNYLLGFNEGGLGLAPYYRFEDKIPAANKEKINKLVDDIKAGRISDLPKVR